MLNTLHPINVSVIIPCYNYARFLPDAVASVVAQTYTCWELLIIDDGSNDDTLATAQQLQAIYPEQRIRVFHQPNCGQAATRNIGADHAQGNYLLYLDADDILAPQTLARMTLVLN